MPRKTGVNWDYLVELVEYSPAGQLAWNLEWFVDWDTTWTERAPVDRDTILTNTIVRWRDCSRRSRLELTPARSAAPSAH